MSRLKKSDINPIVATYSYSKIIKECGKDGELIAELMGVKKPKTVKKKKEDKGEE